MKPELTIQIVGWNHAKLLEQTLQPLRAALSREVVVRYIDNNSTDNSIAVVRSFLPSADVISLPENRGFSGAHNIGLAACSSPYVLVLNPDVVVRLPMILRLLSRFSEERVGAVQGKLLRDRSGKIIDSAGIVLTPTLNGVDRGAGQLDDERWDAPKKIMAVTGACSLYRMEALRQIAHADGQFFDERFFAYKEDVDIGWRLNRDGWQVWYEPVIAGVHHRAVRRESHREIRKVWRRIQDVRTRYSLRNYVWLLIKNARTEQLIIHSPFILARLCLYVLVSAVYWPLLSVWGEIWRGIPEMIGKRREKR